MTQYLSDKIKVISFFSIILVLYIHSDFHDYPHEILGMTYNHYLQDFVSKMIGRCAVPIFFAISGFLFFLHTEDGICSILLKIKKRIRTVLIPFIIASLVFPFFFIILSFFPNSTSFINNNILSVLEGKGVLGILKVLFVDSGTGEPLAFHLWFLRDLILVVAITPILYGMKKYLPVGLPSVLCFIIAFLFPQIGCFTSIFWFVFGSEFLVRLNKIGTHIIPVAFLILCFAELIFPNEYWNYARLPVICIGITTIWNVYDIIVKKDLNLCQHQWFSMICSFTFFIYLYHEPIINIIRKLLVLLIGNSPYSFAIVYLMSPWITAGLMLLIGNVFKKRIPKVYSILVGGR